MELKKINTLERVALLKELGYGVDDEFYVTKDGVRIVDFFMDPVDVRKCDILPGRKKGEVVVINDGLMNLAAYFEYIDDAL